MFIHKEMFNGKIFNLAHHGWGGLLLELYISLSPRNKYPVVAVRCSDNVLKVPVNSK